MRQGYDFRLDADELRQLADRRRDEYRHAQPMPHVVIDGLFPDHVLEQILAEFPEQDDARWVRFNSADEQRFRSSGDHWLGPFTQSFLSYFQSATFVEFVERLTGIDGLIPNPHEAYLHGMRPGGYLHVHADGNWNNRLNVERRLKLLLYINKDWKEEYRGALELWDSHMAACQERILPTFNRLVFLDVASGGHHGVPDILNCPADLTRKVVSMTYCLAPPGRSLRERPHQFRRRPGDKARLTGAAVYRMLTPPILQIQLDKLRAKPAKGRR